MHNNFWGEKKHTTPFIHLSLGEAGPFTLESHIHVKALKMQGFPKTLMPYEILIEKQYPNNFSRRYPMSDLDPQ